MSAALQVPAPMTLDEFLASDAPPGARWQLVDGVPVAMAPASPVHASIQNELGRLIGNDLAAQGAGCRAYGNPGVRLTTGSNRDFRVPGIGVSCSPLVPGEPVIPDPVLLIEILSPSNPRETWSNVWAYTAIPSVQEILVIRADTIEAQLLRCQPGGSWPLVPESIETVDLSLSSIGFRVALDALYVGTWFAAEAGV